MAGVKPISLGRGPTVRRLPLVECVERIRRASQPAVFIHNGSSLDRCGSRTPVEPFQWKIAGTSGDPHIHWVERMFFESPRANFSFALLASILLFIVTSISAFNQKTKRFFIRSEEHEQPNKHSDSA